MRTGGQTRWPQKCLPSLEPVTDQGLLDQVGEGSLNFGKELVPLCDVTSSPTDGAAIAVLVYEDRSNSG